MIYGPGEDSFLMMKQIKDYAKGLVLDMGTGSGIQAEEANKYADEVLAVDVNPEAINYCKKKYKKIKNIEFRESDLFSNITEQFDLIIFNPPYLPNEPKAPDIALDGGPKGYELIEQFLKSAKYNLKTKGVILLLFSSFTNQKKVNKILTTNNYFFRQIDKTHINFEDLFVYEIKKQN